MTEYEVVHEVKNLCPNNQMRDVFIEEVETDDPEGYVRRQVKGSRVTLAREERADGSFVIRADADGVQHVYTFSAF